MLSSHAAAGGTPALNVAAQLLHVVAVGLWIGGLLALLAAIRRRTPDQASATMARRFSRIATVGIATVALTGLVRAVVEVGSVDALLSTDYGHLIIAKTALLAPLALLGAVNHFRNAPSAGRALGGLRRVGSIELLIAASIIALAAALVNVAPPASGATQAGTAAPSPTPAPIVVSGADFGTSVRLRLQIAPGLTGFNTFGATVTDYDSGQPVAADGVTLRFTLPARTDVGSSRLDLQPAGAGQFSATGGNLSIDGIWSVTALVARGADSVEVPLTVAIRSQPQPVDVNRTPGSPTIYVVHLSAGRTVQVYLDPDRAGQNDFHVTFFDAAGAELPATDIGITVIASGQPPRVLDTRTLEPGHVVATLDVDATPQTFVIAATAPGGEPLDAQLTITPGG